MICAISFALLMLTAVVVVIKLARTMTITNRILNDIRRETLPLMARVETTMDHINGELSYLEGILDSLEKLASRADSLTKTAQRFVGSPLVKLVTIGAGVRKALGADPRGEEVTEAGD